MRVDGRSAYLHPAGDSAGAVVEGDLHLPSAAEVAPALELLPVNGLVACFRHAIPRNPHRLDATAVQNVC